MFGTFRHRKLAAGILLIVSGCTAVPTSHEQAYRSSRPPAKSTLAQAAPSSEQLSGLTLAKNRPGSQARGATSELLADHLPQPVAPDEIRKAASPTVALSPSLTIDPATAITARKPSLDDASKQSHLSNTETINGRTNIEERVMTRDASITLASGSESATETDSDAVPPAPMENEGSEDEVDSQRELPVGYALSLGNVLYLADAQNPNVAFARERINEAYARVDRADVLWLPSIRAGMNYIHHEGNVQDVVGNVFETSKSTFYGGLGAGGGGSGSPMFPGLVAQFHLTDAIFQPKIAGHQASSRQFGATAVRNDTLRTTAVAYLELQRAEQSLAISEEALGNTNRLVKLTGDYARTGQGLRSDHERMLAEKAIREADIHVRVEAVRVASARLSQLLHADPSVRISSGESTVIPLELVDKNSAAASFVSTGLMRRPELAEQKHLVREAVERLNREKYAPLVPSLLLGFSYAGQGGGLGGTIINTNDRWDADAMAFWEVRNLGFGERAARNEMSSVVRQTQQRELAVIDQVAREIVEAHSQLIERERRIAVARQGIVAAERSFQLNEERIENAQGLPIESLQAVQALAAARQSYLNAIIDYNIAQFELCRAIGWFEAGDNGNSASSSSEPAGY